MISTEQGITGHVSVVFLCVLVFGMNQMNGSLPILVCRIILFNTGQLGVLQP